MSGREPDAEALAYNWVWSGGFWSSDERTFPFVVDGTPETKKMLDLWRVIAPIAALRIYGPPEVWEARVAAIREALAEVRVPGPLRHHERLGAIAEGGTGLLHATKVYAVALRNAERTLQVEGWRYSHERATAERIGTGNHPLGFRRRLVLAAVHALGQPLSRSAELRRDVARVLAGWLPEDELDPRKDGPIDAALKNETARRAPLGRK